MGDELKQWREIHLLPNWKEFDDRLDGLVYHRNKGHLSGLENDLMRLIDFLATRIKDLERKVEG